ncbi:hypothetical protein NL676_026482 [Syzygium grande]|nr:hypothetical protein NL676_026482 [Syzygium grande]
MSSCTPRRLQFDHDGQNNQHEVDFGLIFFGSRCSLMANLQRGTEEALCKFSVKLEAVGSVDMLGAFCSKGEARCIEWSGLVEALAKDLPQGTVRFGCHVISVTFDPVTSYAVLQLYNGIVMKTMELYVP